MPTIIISGIVAIILVSSSIYYGLKPYLKALYNSIFIDFDFYTLIKTFQLDFNLLDIDYTTLLVAIIMFAITFFVLKRSHLETKEQSDKYGTLSLVAYIFFYFLVIGIIWIGIMLDFIFRKQQKW